MTKEEIERAVSHLITETEIRDLRDRIRDLSSDPRIRTAIQQIASDIIFYNENIAELTNEQREEILTRIYSLILVVNEQYGFETKRTGQASQTLMTRVVDYLRSIANV